MSSAPPYRDRRRRLSEALAEAGLDAALVTHVVNVRYLTGLASSNAACLVGVDGSVVVATDQRYAQSAARDCPDAEIVVERRVGPALAARAATDGGRLGIERDAVTLAENDAIVDAADGRLELVALGGVIGALRAHKDETEVTEVARACELSVAAFTGLLEGPLVGRSERAVARDLEARMLLAGAEGLAFETIVASGPHGAVPHHTPTDRVIVAGDLVTIDFGARVGGYHADCTRTVCAGRPAGWQREVYEVVRAAQAAGVASLGPGVGTRAVDAAARDLIDDAGYGERFVHGLGHGVGLQIHEPPWLASTAEQTARLPDRTTVTVEPGIYLPGSGGVRIEDTTDVGPAGVRVLTGMTTDLLDVTG